ncbi:LOW QUALITY PROTEIN: uncharacterized protein AB9W97_008584 [Spinachia spinachia]
MIPQPGEAECGLLVRQEGFILLSVLLGEEAPENRFRGSWCFTGSLVTQTTEEHPRSTRGAAKEQRRSSREPLIGGYEPWGTFHLALTSLWEGGGDPCCQRCTAMSHPSHAAGAQLCALGLSCVGWTLGAVALGLVQWRVWLVSDSEVITSGRVWRACFDSHTHVTPGSGVMHCRYIGLTEAFTPPEVAAGQVLMLASLLTGLVGNAGAVYSVRNLNFGTEKTSCVRRAFFTIWVGVVGAALMVVSGITFCAYRTPVGGGARDNLAFESH